MIGTEDAATLPRFWDGGAQHLGECRIDVDVADGFGFALAGVKSGAPKNHWDTEVFIKQGASMSHRGVRGSEGLSMVACDDDKGVLIEVLFAQELEEASQLVVRLADGVQVPVFVGGDWFAIFLEHDRWRFVGDGVGVVGLVGPGEREKGTRGVFGNPVEETVHHGGILTTPRRDFFVWGEVARGEHFLEAGLLCHVIHSAPGWERGGEESGPVVSLFEGAYERLVHGAIEPWLVFPRETWVHGINKAHE